MDIENLPYDQRPTFTYDPDSILLAEFRVGKSINSYIGKELPNKCFKTMILLLISLTPA